MVDGSIKHEKTEGSIHKVAATILGAESCNGWTYWHYSKNGSMLPIDHLRQRFILIANFYRSYPNNFPKTFYFLQIFLKKFLINFVKGFDK